MKYPTIIIELVKRPIGLMAFITLVGLYLLAIFAPFLSPYEVSTQNLKKSLHPPTALTWRNSRLNTFEYERDKEDPLIFNKKKDSLIPLKFFAKGYKYKLFGFIPMERHFILIDSADQNARLYLLGSDDTGRDVFSRLLHGAQVSLSIGLIGITITMVFGFLVGGLSGFFGGRLDFMSMRFVELLMAIPGLYLLLALRSTLAPYFQSGQMYLVIVIVLSFIGWAGTARVIRGMSMSLSQRTYVLASKAMGQSTLNILVKHILPNLISYVLVSATLSIPAYILGEAALSFLGLGIQEPSASWGLMLKQSQQMKVFMLNFWWMLTPGFMIFVTVIAFNVLGDALRDIVDPKMKF